MATNHIPEGFHTVTPHMMLKNTGEAIEFYKKAFGAEEIMRMPGPDGKSILHAEIRIGDSIIMLADECPDHKGCQAPQTSGSTSCSICLYVPDTDKAWAQATQAGATGTMPPMDMFWGDRYSQVTDPFGHYWAIATHLKDLTEEEIAEGQKKFFEQMGQCKQ